MLRRFYDWSLEKAHTPQAVFFLVLISFTEASFLIFPPDVLLLVMVLSYPTRWFRYALICTAASVAGGMAGYAIGYGIWEAVDQWFFAHIFSPEMFAKVQHLYQEYDFWVVFTAAFTPIPYKVFTITAGVAHLDLVRFTLASIVGRAGRFFLVSFLIYLFGPPVKAFIDKYFNYVTLVFTGLLIGGFFLLRSLSH